MRTIISRTLVLFFLLSVSSNIYAQINVKRYVPVTSDIANPERGWYDAYTNFGSFLTGSYYSLDSNTLKQKRVEDNVTLIMRLFYLHQFVNEDEISGEYLNLMQQDFDAIRDAGVKCIVRFAYSDSPSAEHLDAEPSKVFSHIKSLGNVLSKNSDVIATVQAGFIGAWGEWYYTKNFAGAGYVPSEEDIENRRKVVSLLLDVLPDNIQVQVRTPEIKQYTVQSSQTIYESNAYTGEMLSRVAHHNDCFLANRTDYGTYLNIEDDLAYLSQDTKYTIAGGETCDGSNSYSDCQAAIPRMRLLHWTYLNRGYNKTVYRKWKEQGCHDSVTMNLGYRISIDSARVTPKANPGDTIMLEFSFLNSGFAAPTQNKDIRIYLEGDNENIFEVEYESDNDDIRYWLPGKIDLKGEVIIPESTEPGNYRIGISFTDQDSVLSSNPAYSIQLANLCLWESSTGINWLNQFVALGDVEMIELPEALSNLSGVVVSDNHVELSWENSMSSDKKFQLYRKSHLLSDWELIAELGNDTTSYIDYNVVKGETYNYIVRSVSTVGESDWSNIIEIILGLTGVNNHSNKKVILYPNPVNSGVITVSVDNLLIKSIDVFDINQRRIFQKQNIDEKKVQINCNDLKSGVYFMKITTSQNSVLVRKFIVE